MILIGQLAVTEVGQDLFVILFINKFTEANSSNVVYCVYFGFVLFLFYFFVFTFLALI